MKSFLSICLITVLTLSLLVTPAFADASPTVNPIDAFERQVEADVADGFPSAQLAVIKDGELVYSNAWGYTRAYNTDQTINADRTFVSTDTLYDIGGDTSVFTIGYIVNHLVSQGELSFDAKVVDILGEQFVSRTLDYRGTPYEATLPDYETMLEWKRSLTVENLLRYQSGLPVSCRFHNDTYDFVTGDYETDTPNPFYVESGTRAETLEKLYTVPLFCEPGKVTTVTDTDYILLAFVIEAITGQPLDTYLYSTFLAPLGLEHITFNPCNSGFAIDDCAATELTGNTRGGFISFPHIRRHVIQGEVHDEMSYYSMEGVSGHAGLFANAEDLARFAYLSITNEPFFHADTTQQMLTPNSDNADHGMGWYRRVATDDNVWLFGNYASANSFGIAGFTHCSVVIDPDNSLVIAYLTDSISSPIGFTDPTNPSIATLKFTGNDFASAKLNAPMDAVYSWLGLHH